MNEYLFLNENNLINYFHGPLLLTRNFTFLLMIVIIVTTVLTYFKIINNNASFARNIINFKSLLICITNNIYIHVKRNKSLEGAAQKVNINKH